MKISYNWLRQFIDLEESPEEVGNLLTSIGLEVEGIEKFESVKGGLTGLVVGEVKEKTQHPNADRLSCTKVDIGSGELLPIVCGAPNVAQGQKVIVAPVGTTLHTVSGETFQIKNAKIRGEESRGMICAEDEIGIGQSHEGIMVLPADTPVGKAVSELFDVQTDYVFEIGLTPNRADAASHLGVARDLRAALHQRKRKKLELTRPSVEGFKVGAPALEIPVEVKNPEACPRYVGVTISGLKVGPSPQWLQNRLKAIGLRPINNVVDVTNYVNHGFGQPLHAFDAGKIEGGKVIVDTNTAKTKFTTLDGVERELHSEDLMICNASEAMCIAGVFGGAKSGVTESTTAVFLESAYFNPVWVRKTAKRHGLHTDASFRFERGIDPNITAYAAKYAALLIKEVAGGTISSELSDTHPGPFPPFEVTYNASKANAFIGAEIPEEDVANILGSLEVEIADRKSEVWQLRVPSFKVDVTREADVIEEVLRIFGYDEVKFSSKMRSTIKDMKPSTSALAREAVTQLLTGNGFLECMSNSMVDERYGTLSKEWEEQALVHLNNPLSSEMGIMRPALVFSALQNAAYNLNRQQLNLKLFEFGNIYRTTGDGFREEERLGLLVSGQQVTDSWRIANTPADWYFLKGAFEQMFLRLGLDNAKFKTSESPNDWFDFGLDWSVDGQIVVSAGAVSNTLKKHFDIKRDVFYLELRWNALLETRKEKIAVGELPKYPEVRRDLALLIDKAVQYEALERLAYQCERKLLKKVRLFDVYEGKGLPSGKKSYALAFSLQDEQKTLTDQEVDNVMSRLLERFRSEAGAELRG